MVQIIQAQVTLQQLITLYGLQLIEGEQFFREWQDQLPELTDLEKQLLDQVKAGYLNLRNYPPLLENTLNTVVLSPLGVVCDDPQSASRRSPQGDEVVCVSGCHG